MTTADPTDVYLTIGEVAALLDIPAGTLRYWRHMHQGPRTFHIGRKTLYDRMDVERFARKINAVAEILGEFADPQRAFAYARTAVLGVYRPGGAQ